MRDPKRWLDEGGGAPNGARELLAVADPLPEIPSLVHQSILGHATAMGLAKAPLWAAPTLVKATVVAAVTAAGAGGATMHGVDPFMTKPRANAPAISTAAPLRAREPSTDHRPPPERATTTATISAPVVQLDELEPIEDPPSPGPRVPQGARSRVPTSSLTEEAALLDDARGRLSTDPAAAIAELDAYRARHAGGQLRAAAAVIRIDALMRTGQTDAAQRLAAAELRAAPTGLYAERIRDLLASDAAERGPRD